jgi:hypothetical protein
MGQPETSWTPDRKVMAGGVAGLVAWGLMVVAARYGYVVPAEMQPVLSTVVSIAIAYVVPPSQQDILKRLNDQIVAVAENRDDIPVTKPPVPPASRV